MHLPACIPLQAGSSFARPVPPEKGGAATRERPSKTLFGQARSLFVYIQVEHVLITISPFLTLFARDNLSAVKDQCAFFFDGIHNDTGEEIPLHLLQYEVLTIHDFLVFPKHERSLLF
jgi:hypothetical protein